MSKLLKKCTSLCVLVFCFNLQAREIVNDMVSSWISFRDEFESNYIETVDIDSFGNVWIGSSYGIGYFDGVKMNCLTKGMGIISGNELNYVYADKTCNRIWFATKRNGLGYYDMDSGASVFFSAKDGSIPSDEVTSIDQDVSGNIWFSTYPGHICRLEVDTKNVTVFNPSTVDGLPRTFLRSVKVSRDGKVYAAYYGQGVAVLYPEENRAERLIHDSDNPASLPSNQIGSIYLDDDGNLWVGTRRGLALYRPITKDFSIFDKENSGLPDGLVFAIVRTIDGRLLASPDMEGLWSMDLNGKERQFARVNIPDCDDVGIRAIRPDRYGNLWLGTSGKGLVCRTSVNRSGVSAISSPEILTEQIVRGVAFSKSGTMYVATDGGGLNVIRKLEEKEIASGNIPDLPDENVISVYVDSQDNVWAGTFDGGVVVFDDEMRTRATLPIMEVRAFCEKDGMMWLASGLNGLYSVNIADYSISGHYTSPDYFPDNYLKSLCIDVIGRIWVGTFRAGLFVFDQGMNLIGRFGSDNGFASDSINDIEADSSGYVWVATGEGLCRFSPEIDPHAISCDFTDISGLSSEIIMGVREDYSRNIWISTTRSISRISNGKLREYPSNLSGMSLGNFSSGAIAGYSNGVMAFGTSDGVIICKVDNDEIYNEGAEIHFSGMSLFLGDKNKSKYYKSGILNIDSGSTIRLKHNENNISLSFATKDISLLDCVDYEYRIKGLDKDLHRTSDNEIILFQLRPGRYTITVKPVWRGGNTLGPESQLRIIVLQPFWWSLFMKLVYLMLIALASIRLIISIIRHRVRKVSIEQQREFDELKDQFVDSVSHHLKTPLAMIAGPARSLYEDVTLNKGARRKARTIMKNVEALMDFTNEFRILSEKERVGGAGENEDFSKEVRKKKLTTSDIQFIEKLTLYIESNISSEEVDVGSIANVMGMSTSSLYRRMMSTLGVSANDFVRRIKMRRAAELLSAGECNVSETAWRVGMNSMAYFRQCFKEEYGVTPSEFRANGNFSGIS